MVFVCLTFSFDVSPCFHYEPLNFVEIPHFGRFHFSQLTTPGVCYSMTCSYNFVTVHPPSLSTLLSSSSPLLLHPSIPSTLLALLLSSPSLHYSPLSVTPSLPHPLPSSLSNPLLLSSSALLTLLPSSPSLPSPVLSTCAAFQYTLTVDGDLPAPRVVSLIKRADNEIYDIIT